MEKDKTVNQTIESSKYTPRQLGKNLAFYVLVSLGIGTSMGATDAVYHRFNGETMAAIEGGRSSNRFVKATDYVFLKSGRHIGYLVMGTGMSDEEEATFIRQPFND